jgi:dienelactone hydrolase
MATHNTNVGCCTIPPVQSEYTPKGSFKSVGSFNKVYVTGPDTSTNAIVCVYDIFGYFPQTQQGADIVASTLKTTVYMPDFFEPDGPFPHDPFPPTTPEGQQALQDFFGTTANPPKNVEKLIVFGNHLKSNGANNVGLYGFCWGGKVSVLAGGDNTPFSAVSIIHPAMLSADDSTKLTIPLAIYPSKDEPIDEFKKIVGILDKKGFAEKCDNKYYSNMHHGWAAARADLANEENKKEFEDVYTKLVNFFKNTLQD